MTVTTVYANSVEGYVVSSAHSTWAAARDSSTGTSVFDANNYVLSGARFTTNYDIYQGMSKYDVSAITGTVSSTVWNTYTNFINGTDTYGIKAVNFDWGAAVDTSDINSRSELLALTLLASTPFPSTLNSWVQWTSESGMNSYIQNATTAYFLTCSDRQYSNVTPVGDVYAAYASNRTTFDSYLTVTWAPPEVTGTAAASLGALTATASGTVTHPGTATASFGVTAAASGAVAHVGAATLAGELTASATGVVTRFGTAEATASLTAGATGICETFGTSSFTSSISAEGVGTREVSGTSSFSAELISTANGTRTVVGNTSFVSTESMSANGTVEHVGTASLAGSLQASAVGLRTVNGSASFAVSLTATARSVPTLYVFTYTASVAVGGTTHTTTIGDTTQGAAMGDNTDSAASLMIREAS